MFYQTMSVLKQLISNSNTNIEFTETKFDHDSETCIDEMEEAAFVSYYTNSIISKW